MSDCECPICVAVRRETAAAWAIKPGDVYRSSPGEQTWFPNDLYKEVADAMLAKEKINWEELGTYGRTQTNTMPITDSKGDTWIETKLVDPAEMTLSYRPVTVPAGEKITATKMRELMDALMRPMSYSYPPYGRSPMMNDLPYMIDWNKARADILKLTAIPPYYLKKESTMTTEKPPKPEKPLSLPIQLLIGKRDEARLNRDYYAKEEVAFQLQGNAKGEHKRKYAKQVREYEAALKKLGHKA